jgi:hypothetical protein
MSNYMDEENASDFRDIPEEAGGDPTNQPAEFSPPPPQRRSSGVPKQAAPPPPPVQVEEEQVEEEQPEEIEDYTDVLSDARLRLEQGRLYELIMNNDFFSGTGYDPKAIKNVEKEIRNFAKERMEIMLGMRQEAAKEAAFPMDAFPFNALEVEVLKSLASAATKGATASAEPFNSVQVPRKTTLNPIALRTTQPAKPVAKPVVKAPAKPLPSKPAPPVKRPQVSEAIQRILDETGVTLEDIDKTFDPNYKALTPDDLVGMTQEEIDERNLQGARRTQRKAPAKNTIPMPTLEQENMMYQQRVQAENSNPNMQRIMGHLLGKK